LNRSSNARRALFVDPLPDDEPLSRLAGVLVWRSIVVRGWNS
jgi:hypothetical protein